MLTNLVEQDLSKSFGLKQKEKATLADVACQRGGVMFGEDVNFIIIQCSRRYLLFALIRFADSGQGELVALSRKREQNGRGCCGMHRTQTANLFRRKCFFLFTSECGHRGFDKDLPEAIRT